jgi:hypothetical protein
LFAALGRFCRGDVVDRQEMILGGSILEFSFRAVEKALVAPLGISAAESVASADGAV